MTQATLTELPDGAFEIVFTDGEHTRISLTCAPEGGRRLETNLGITEADADWEWDQRVAWNAAVDGGTSMLLSCMTHVAHRFTRDELRVFFRKICTDFVQNLENQF